MDMGGARHHKTYTYSPLSYLKRLKETYNFNLKRDWKPFVATSEVLFTMKRSRPLRLRLLSHNLPVPIEIGIPGR